MSARGSTVAVEVPIVLSWPSDAEVPAPGTWVEVIGRLSAVSWQSDAVARLSAGEVTVLAPPGAVDVAAHAMRRGLRSALSGTSPDAGSLVAGLSVGDDWGQPADLADDMRASGLSHLTAVSGGNVAIVLAAVLTVATLLRLQLTLRVGLSLAALAYFAVLVGPQPSVLRACAMGAIATAGLLSGGRRAGPSVLGAGVLLLVLTVPWLATSWAFALSVLATAGLVLLSSRLADMMSRWRPTRRWPPVVRQALALTAAAQLATLPVLVAMGASVGWVALPANLVVMPVVAPITVLGLVAAAISPVAPGVAAVVSHWAAWPASWIALVAHTGADLPLARLPWPAGWWGLAALAAITAAVPGDAGRDPSLGDAVLDPDPVIPDRPGNGGGGLRRSPAAGSAGPSWLAPARLVPDHVRCRPGRRPGAQVGGGLRSGGGCRARSGRRRQVPGGCGRDHACPRWS